MKHSLLLWVLAVVITAGSAVYQRMTGPTYPFSGTVTLDGTDIRFVLERSHSSSSACPVSMPVPDQSFTGTLEWKRNNSADPWTRSPLVWSEGRLTGMLPAQPPAGKLAYHVTLVHGMSQATFPEEPVVVRFKGDVPLPVLITHIALMFLGMLFSTRCGLEALRAAPAFGTKVYWTLCLLVLGGLLLGPLVQYYAFGALWTGWPAGHDLTDNKTAAIVLAWLLAAVRLKRSRSPGRWVIAASVITLAVYLIPHSLLGSALAYDSAGGP